ncbi:ribosomal protein S21 [Rhizobium sp. OAE497]
MRLKDNPGSRQSSPTDIVAENSSPTSPALDGLLEGFEPISVEEPNLKILVRENNVDQALRFLKKKLQQEGVFREMRLREHYEKPSEKRAREKAEGIRRTRKLAQKKLNRELGISSSRKAKLKLAPTQPGAK